LRLECSAVVANLTPWALRDLLGEAAPPALRREAQRCPATWGAFMVYLGLDAAGLPAGAADHHQVIVDPSQPLGEGNSIFLSLSDAADPSRAPAGLRAATLSTHTEIAPWQAARQRVPAAYDDRVAAYVQRLLSAAEQALPDLGHAVRFSLPGTPAAFERFTRRPLGMVGGFPQTSLFAARGVRTGLANAWLVGDSVFPGQSTAGVTLGALRAAEQARRALAVTVSPPQHPTPRRAYEEGLPAPRVLTAPAGGSVAERE
jgi:phytoene dehydrogenase-like protein